MIRYLTDDNYWKNNLAELWIIVDPTHSQILRLEQVGRNLSDVCRAFIALEDVYAGNDVILAFIKSRKKQFGIHRYACYIIDPRYDDTPIDDDMIKEALEYFYRVYGKESWHEKYDSYGTANIAIRNI